MHEWSLLTSDSSTDVRRSPVLRNFLFIYDEIYEKYNHQTSASCNFGSRLYKC